MVPTTKEEVKAICHNLPTLCHKPTLDKKKKGKKKKKNTVCSCLRWTCWDKKDKNWYSEHTCVWTLKLSWWFVLSLAVAQLQFSRRNNIWVTKQEHKCGVCCFWFHWCLRKEFLALVVKLWRRVFLKVCNVFLVSKQHLIFIYPANVTYPRHTHTKFTAHTDRHS